MTVNLTGRRLRSKWVWCVVDEGCDVVAYSTTSTARFLTDMDGDYNSEQGKARRNRVTT